MNTTQIGVDLAKSVFEVAVSHTPGRVHERHRLSRTGFLRFFATCPPAHVLLEACSSAHHWGRELQGLGHDVALLPPADVARYRDGNKTDRADAKALLEAARNEAIDRVPGQIRRAAGPQCAPPALAGLPADSDRADQCRPRPAARGGRHHPHRRLLRAAQGPGGVGR